MKIQSTDDHLVLHDAAILAVAGALGGTAGAVTGSPEIGTATAVAVAGLGISAMAKVGPIRRTVNRAVIAVSEVSR